MVESDYMLQFCKRLKLYTKLVPVTVCSASTSKFIGNDL